MAVWPSTRHLAVLQSGLVVSVGQATETDSPLALLFVIGTAGQALESDTALAATGLVKGFIALYSGSPTSGGTDGTKITNGAPLTFTFMAPNMSQTVKMAVRADTGKSRSGTFPILIRGDASALQFALAPDSSGSPGTFGMWGDTLYLTGPIGDTNKVFWLKARTNSADAFNVAPYEDDAVSLVYPANAT